MELLCACQGIDLLAPLKTSPALQRALAALRSRVPMLEADRRQDVDIAQVLELHRQGLLPCPKPTDGPAADA